MAEYTFIVKEGMHHDGPIGSVREYQKGDVVKSDKELDKLFVNKFERVEKKAGKKTRADSLEEDDEDERVTERKRSAKEPTPAERQDALERSNRETMEQDEEENEDAPKRGRSIMEGVDDDEDAPKKSKRGQHAKAGQEGGGASDEEVNPDPEEGEEDEEPVKPKRRPMKKRRKSGE